MSDVTKRMIIRVAGLLVVVIVAVAVTLTLTVAGRRSSASTTRAALAEQVPGAVLPAQAPPVLPSAGTDAPVPSATALARALRPLMAAGALGGSFSLDVLDPLTGEHLLDRTQSTPRTPASTAKLLTSAAALTLLGPQTTLPTTVLAGRTPGQLVLVGGGDVLLAKGAGDPEAVNGHAGLTTLARQTALALRAQGTTTVRIALDDRLFTGPTRGPGWAPTDVSDGFVAPIQPLEINDGRLGPADYAPRSGDPAMAAATFFAGLLRAQGVRVTGAVQRGSAAPGAAVLGQVRSAPVSGLVEYALTNSDNTVAEMLGRFVAARSGRTPAFAEVGPAVLAEDAKLGIPVAGARLVDGSGLSATSVVPPLALTGVLAAAMAADQPQLRAILSGLPVAGVSGTLRERYAGAAQRPATGMVRAKTGTLTGVTSLAGTVIDADGRLLVFAAMADKAKSTIPARNALDRIAGRLATCGCR